MLSRPSPRRIALNLGLAAALAVALGAGPARAADTGNGSKNFSTPATVPNYFSNEAGPMLGPAYETQRGELYGGANRAAAASEAPSRYRHVAMAVPRGRVVRGRHGERVVARHVAVHGHSTARVAAHGSSRTHSAVAHAAAHTTAKAPVVSTHRRVRS